MKKLKSLLFLLSTLFMDNIFSQTIPDNSGKDVFVVRTINKFSTGVQTTSAKISYNSMANHSISYHRPNVAAMHLTKSFHSLGIELSARNITQSYDKFFSNINQPTIELNAGWIASNVTNINDWHNLKQAVSGKIYRPRTYDFYLGGYLSNAFINHYNTDNQVLTEAWKDFGKFFRAGVKSNLNLYYTDWFVFAINASVDYGKLSDNLKSFQNTIPAVVSNSPNIIVDLGKVAGKYSGDIDNNVNTRFSLSIPIFLGNLFFNSNNTSRFANTFRKISMIPHYSPFGAAGNTWTQMVGASINFLAQSYARTNATILPGAGVGIDWKTDISAASQWSRPIYYIYGSINLGSLIPTSNNPAVTQPANRLR